jgi:imidazolonepropionase-like amidohydrolase
MRLLIVLAPALLIVFAAGCASTPAAVGPTEGWDRAADSVAALAHFRSNIRSIHERDRPAYLEHYLRSERLAMAGPAGVAFGYDRLASGDPDAWPDTLVATHLEVTPLAPGVVYGAYRYRVVGDGTSQRGVSERVFVRQPGGGWAIAVSSAFRSPGDGLAPPVALTGATVIDGTGAAPLANATVVLRDGRVACVGECAITDDVQAIDASGRWIIPGLVDAHVHYSQTGWADGRPDATDLRDRFPYEEVMADLRNNPQRFHRAFLCAGVTSVFDVGGYPWTQELPRETEGVTDAPRVAAAGPLITTVDHWINLADERQLVFVDSEEATRLAVRTIAARGTDAVKVWYITAEGAPDAAERSARLHEAAEEARQAGAPLIVHATTLWAAKDALRAGAHMLVHSVEDQPVDEEFLSLMRQRGAVYSPTLTVRQGYVDLLARSFDPAKVPLACVDPETRRKAALTNELPPPAGIDVEAYAARADAGYRTMLANLRAVHEAGITVATGTDAGNPLTLHGPSIYHEMEAMAEAGLSPMDILVATTRNGARAMSRDDFGTIETGMAADLLVLDHDPLVDIRNVRGVRLIVRNGEVWTQDELAYDD